LSRHGLALALALLLVVGLAGAVGWIALRRRIRPALVARGLLPRAFLDHGRLLLDESDPAAFSIWRVDGGEPVLDRRIDRDKFDQIVSHGANVLAITRLGRPTSVRFVDATTGREIGKFADNELKIVTLSPGGHLFAWNKLTKFQILDVASGKLVKAMPDEGFEEDVRFSPDERSFGATDNDPLTGKVETKVWSLETGKALVLPGRLAGFTERSEPLTTGALANETADQEFQVHAADDGRLLRSWVFPGLRNEDRVADSGAAIAANGPILPDGRSSVEVRALDDGRLLKKIPTAKALTNLVIAPGGDRVAVSYLESKTVEIWDVGR
jgi:hypothetical protein